MLKTLVDVQAPLIGAVSLPRLHHLDRHERARDVFQGVGSAVERFLNVGINRGFTHCFRFALFPHVNRASLNCLGAQ
jgi:hypothetical protein